MQGWQRAVSTLQTASGITPANARDMRHSGPSPGSGRSPGGGHDHPLQSSCLGNPMDRGVYGVTLGASGAARARDREPRAIEWRWRRRRVPGLLGWTGSPVPPLSPSSSCLGAWPGKLRPQGWDRIPRETGLILRCAGKAGNPFQTTQGNRLPCRDQEGRSGSEE